MSAALQGKNNDYLIRSDKKSVKKIQNYQERYLKYVFIHTSTVFNDEPHPKCMLCFDIIDNDSMKPSWLARHLKTKCPEQDKPVPLFFSDVLSLLILNLVLYETSLNSMLNF